VATLVHFRRPAIQIRAVGGGQSRRRPTQTNVGTSQKGHFQPTPIPFETRQRRNDRAFRRLALFYESLSPPDRHTSVWPPSRGANSSQTDPVIDDARQCNILFPICTCVVRHRWTRPRGTYKAVHGRSTLSPLANELRSRSAARWDGKLTTTKSFVVLS
jgi:hypothetical protein